MRIAYQTIRYGIGDRALGDHFVSVIHLRSTGKSYVCAMNESQPMSETEGFLTKRELAARLQKTPRCIETWMKRHYLPYIKIGHSVLFRWPDVLAGLKRFEVK